MSLTERDILSGRWASLGAFVGPTSGMLIHVDPNASMDRKTMLRVSRAAAEIPSMVQVMRILAAEYADEEVGGLARDILSHIDDE